jgi:hypothetical protein
VPETLGPSCQNVQVIAHQTTTLVGSFSPTGFLPVTTTGTGGSAPTIYVNGVAVDDFGYWAPAAPTTFFANLVCASKVVGFRRPAYQQASITAGQTTTVSFDYSSA